MRRCKHRGKGALLAASALFWCGLCGAIRKCTLGPGNYFTQVGPWLYPDSDKYTDWWCDEKPAARRKVEKS